MITFLSSCTLEYGRLLNSHGPLTRYVKLQVAHVPGMPGTFSPPPRVSDPDMYHGTFSFEAGDGKNVPDIPGACTTRNFTYLVRGPCEPQQPAMLQCRGMIEMRLSMSSEINLAFRVRCGSCDHRLINWLVHGICCCNLRLVIFNLVSRILILGISC